MPERRDACRTISSASFRIFIPEIFLPRTSTSIPKAFVPKIGAPTSELVRVSGRSIGPATVPTLAEAEVFAAAGVRDIVYAVGIAPGKLGRVLALRRGGCDLAVLLDSVAQAEAVAAASRDAGSPIPALIEIDSDGHRGGLAPDDSSLVAIGRILHEDGARLRILPNHACATAAQHGAYRVLPAEAGAPLVEWARFGGW